MKPEVTNQYEECVRSVPIAAQASGLTFGNVHYCHLLEMAHGIEGEEKRTRHCHYDGEGADGVEHCL